MEFQKEQMGVRLSITLEAEEAKRFEKVLEGAYTYWTDEEQKAVIEQYGDICRSYANFAKRLREELMR